MTTDEDVNDSLMSMSYTQMNDLLKYHKLYNMENL